MTYKDNRPVVSTDQLYMLRCLIAMAHADGVLDRFEEGYILDFIDNLNLSKTQEEQLHSDLITPAPISELLPHISNAKYRGQLTYFARLIAYIDGNLHPDEEKLLKLFADYAGSCMQPNDLIKQGGTHTIPDTAPKDPKKRIAWVMDQALITLGLKTKLPEDL